MKSSGYAVILALLFVALLSLLLLCFVDLLWLEQGVARAMWQQQRSRDVCRAVMNQARGDLIAYAGSDGSYTRMAQADEPSHWVYAHAETDEPRALVATGQEAENWIQVPSEWTAGRSVAVPEVLWQRENERWWTSYWVDDEGMKAYIDLAEKAELEDLLAQRLRFGGARLPPELEEKNEHLSLVESMQQRLPFWSQWAEVWQEPVGSLAADFTLFSQGLLTDPIAGGFKRDLSYLPHFEDGQGWTAPAVREFLQFRGDHQAGVLLRGVTEEEENAGLPAGEPAFTIKPQITEWALHVGFFPKRREGRGVGLFTQLKAELWYPYAYALRHAVAGAEGITVELTRLPDLQLRYLHSDDYNETLAMKSFSLLEADLRYDIDFTASHQPGEVVERGAKWQGNASVSRDNFYYHEDWDWELPDVPLAQGADRLLEISFAAGEVDLEVRGRDGQLLWRLRHVPLPAFSVLQEIDVSNDAGSLLTASNHTAYHAKCTYHWRLRDLWYNHSEALGVSDREWVGSVWDWRWTTWDLSDENWDWLRLIEMEVWSSGTAQTFQNTDFFEGTSNNHYISLYDLPSQPLPSLGLLTHMPIQGKAAFALGNEWGQQSNQLLDQFFLSGLHYEAAVQPSSALSFLHFSQPVQDVILLQEEAVSQMAIRGAFNVNSQSVEAWYAFLRSSAQQSYAVERITLTGESEWLPRSESAVLWSRLPYSGHRFYQPWGQESSAPWQQASNYPQLNEEERKWIWQDPNALVLNDSWRPAYQWGLREYSDEQVRDLATNIAERVANYEGGFASLSEWINAGILQAAIDDTDINTLLPAVSYEQADPLQRIPRMANVFLAQSDVISHAAALLTHRSDTFWVYAMARLEGSPATWARALMQRRPEVVQTREEKRQHRRAYHILYWQWL